VQDERGAAVPGPRVVHPGAAGSRAPPPVLFENPFERLVEDVFGAREGPIDVARGNFAQVSDARLQTVSADPPIYVVDDFLSAEECAAIIAAAENGRFPRVPYGAKNKIFTGTKFAAEKQDPSLDVFLEKASAAFAGIPGGAPSTRFEPVTVTRYDAGQFQAKHLDARISSEVRRDAAYLAAGGARLAQLIVYLQAPEAGGATKFYGPVLGGIAVEPRAGRALIFPVSDLAGTADERYLHEGAPVERGTKWIIGTWLLQTPRTDAADVAKQIRALWDLEGRKPPPAAKPPAAAKPKAPRITTVKPPPAAAPEKPGAPRITVQPAAAPPSPGEPRTKKGRKKAKGKKGKR
jgi:prolyl 4-hydroxylase